MKRLQTKASLLGIGMILWIAVLSGNALGQATFTAQLRGTIQDASNAAVPRAAVTLTNEATNVSEKTVTDEEGRYFFNSVRPAEYTVKVEAAGFKSAVQSRVALRVDQKADLDFVLEVGEVTTTVDVSASAPLLNSVSAALGQEVTNRYVTEVPLFDRNIVNLAFLAPGVTEVGGGLFGNTADITGVNYVSNGQRNSTAEIRVDGGLATAPETGEGGTFTVAYRPSIEIVQEFKVQNNGLSAEYGNNGGTVINMVTKSGTNEFHGSGYWFFRRPYWDANNFFANRAGEEKSDFKRDNYGGSIGGPIVKQKTFFFFDYDRVRFEAPATLTTTVPTALERRGDFSQTFNPDGSLRQIFNPFDGYQDAQGNYKRRPFAGNVIPASLSSPLALNLMELYPEPNSDGDAFTHFNNFTKNATSSNPFWQFDVKIDHNFSENSRIFGRYSRNNAKGSPALFFNNPADSASQSVSRVHDAVLEYTWTLNPTTVWTTRGALSRQYSTNSSLRTDITQFGFPSLLSEVSGVGGVFPRIDIENYSSLGVFGWTDTIANRTLVSLASSLSKVIGPHNIKFGGEQRIYFANFWQPGFPGGFFQFNSLPTTEDIFDPSPNQGNGVASLLLDWGDPYSWGGINIQPGTATKSKETAFFVQDDWRITQRLTLNLGLRYEWSTPFTVRFDREALGDPLFDTGIDVPGIGRIRGANRLVDSEHRTAPVDRNNLAPRFGLAFRIDHKTVIRGGFGLYYGLSPATNSWLTGPSFRKYAGWLPSLDGGISRFATLENPFPNGGFLPQDRKYGNLNMWGFSSDTVLSDNLRNAEIYQWNVGVQRELTPTLLFEVAYSASRSTHLPFDGSQNVNFVSKQDREKWGTAGLNELVANPFQPLFQGPNATFNEPDSIYNNETIPRINLLRPFPQFNGGFTEGRIRFNANARYNSLQFRFEKRYSHGLNFVGSYTFSKLTDDSSAGFNTWLGNAAGIQDPTNLRGEHSIGGSDTPQRIVFGWSYELPIGRGRKLGNNWGKVTNVLIGGWQLNGFVTYQSGNPVPLYSFNSLADGAQRPNLQGNPRSSLSIHEVVDGKGNFFNFNPAALECADPAAGAICAPAPQQPGNSPRFNPDLRGDSIRRLDLSIFKNFQFRETMKLQVRAEFFNFTNTPRFGFPSSSLGDPAFGTINSQINSPRQAQIGLRFLF